MENMVNAIINYPTLTLFIDTGNIFAAGFIRVLKLFAVHCGLLLVRLQEFQALRIAHVSSCTLSS